MEDGTYSNGVCNVNIAFTSEGAMNISLNIIN